MMKTILREVLYYVHFPIFLFVKKEESHPALNKRYNYIFAANHASSLDPVLMGMYFRKKYGLWVRFLAAEKIYRNAAIRVYLYAFDAIKINESDKKASIEKAVDVLKKGGNIGIFPEGRCVLKRNVQVKTGAVRIALRSGRKILPVRIVGTDKMLPPGRKIPIPGRVRIIIGKPISLKGVRGRINLKKESEKIMDRVYSLE